MIWASMVAVGRVSRPQGNRGEVIVIPDTDFGEERFRPGAVVFADGGDAPPKTLTVAESREHRGVWVVRFSGVESIDGAETLRGTELRVPDEALRPLDPGTYYVHELLGCRVRTSEGEDVGRVARVDLPGGVPILAVAGVRGEILVPLVDAICRRVDVAAKAIEIDAPAGLLELNVKTGERP